MYSVKAFVEDANQTCVLSQRMHHLPNCGDTMRLSGERYFKITEVVWAMDEETTDFIGQRINLRLEKIDG